MVVSQGDVFWVHFREPIGSEPGGLRPAIVVQSDEFNASPLRTIVVCGITSNLRLGDAPGNVRLARGEANLERPSIANITQLAAVDRGWLRRKIGTLSSKRLEEVLDGVQLLIRRSSMS